MPPDPKKPIEEMLEASAKARRAKFGRDPAMPNPMRARLHEEIARLERTEGTGARRASWLQMFWPRLAVAGALAALLVIAPVMWWRNLHPNGSVAMETGTREPGAINEFREATSPPADEVLSKGPAVAAAQPNVSLDDKSRAKLEPEQTPAAMASGSLDQTKAVVEARPAATKSFLSRTEAKTTEREVTAAGQIQSAAPVLAPGASQEAAESRVASTAASSGAAGSPTTEESAHRGVAQAFRNNMQTNRTANVLTNFRVQQEGSEIRIVDADGSTYTGTVRPIAETANRAVAGRKQDTQSRVESQNIAGPPQSRFRASGFNVSLKKPLVFEGDYVPSSVPAEQFRVEPRKDASAPTQESARIVGRATMHGETPVEVDAVSIESSEAAQKARQ